MLLQQDLASGSDRCRLDLFEDKVSAYCWIKKEQEIQLVNEWSKMYKFYNSLFPKEIFLSQFFRLIEEKDAIDSITLTDKNGVRRLYFRQDIMYGYDAFPKSSQKLDPKEPIYIIYRHRKLDEQVILHKELHFITYPEIAKPLFSIGNRDWAEELIPIEEEHQYYIEQTTLYDVYMRAKLETKDPGFFILSREVAPHYILRKRDLKNIIEGRVEYQ